MGCTSTVGDLTLRADAGTCRKFSSSGTGCRGSAESQRTRLRATVLGAEATEHGGRWRLTRDGAEVATVRATEGSEVARWLHYLAVDDLTAAVQRATAAGAEVVEEADDRVRLVDPFGAVFGLAHAPHPPASPAPL